MNKILKNTFIAMMVKIKRRSSHFKIGIMPLSQSEKINANSKSTKPPTIIPDCRRLNPCMMGSSNAPSDESNDSSAKGSNGKIKKINPPTKDPIPNIAKMMVKRFMIQFFFVVRNLLTFSVL